jgi:excisionase family DNA binding protein
MLMGIDEAAKYLGLQPSTLRRWSWERRIPTVKLGRRVLFRQDALDELIARSERGITTARAALATRK